MSAALEAKTVTKFTGMVPAFQVKSYQETVEHYVKWLGFNLDWEWREAPGKPVIMHISRDGVALFLNEYDDGRGPAMLNVLVADIRLYADEVNARRLDSVKVEIEPPYDIPAFQVTDTFGNTISFKQPISEDEQASRKSKIPQIRKYIQDQINAGKLCPTPEEVVAALGGPIGLAIETLFEFPEYNSKP